MPYYDTGYYLFHVFFGRCAFVIGERVHGCEFKRFGEKMVKITFRLICFDLSLETRTDGIFLQNVLYLFILQSPSYFATK